MKTAALVYCFLWAVVASAQKNTPVLEKNITINCNNEPISSILEKLEKQAGVRFSYNPLAIHANKSASLYCKQKPLRIALYQLFQQKVTFKQSGNIIILTAVKPVAKPPDQIELIGYIYNEDGDRLPQASIYSKTHKVSCVSNQHGYYVLKIPARALPVKLSIAKNEFRDTSIVITSAMQDQHIVLQAAFKNQLFTQSYIPLDTITNTTKTTDTLPTATIPKDTIERKHAFKRLIEKMVISDNIKSNLKNIRDTFFTKTQIGLVPYISTNSLLSANTINDYSINLLAGYSQGVNKIEVGGIANINRGNVKYAQLAGITNINAGNVTGVQLAGIGNSNLGKTHGIQLAGIYNMGTDLHGIQAAGIANINASIPDTFAIFKQWTNNYVYGIRVAGIANVNAGYFTGIQAAGIANIGKHHDGIQLAGISNIGMGKASGVSIAGIGNINYDTSNGYAIAGITNLNYKQVKGTQIAGIANVSWGEVDGLQIASLVNIAKHINSSQIALLNFSDSAKGLPVGFLSFVKSGYHKFEIWGNDWMYTQLAYRTGVQKFHNIFSIGIDLTSRFDGVWCYGYGVGSAFNVSPTWLLQQEIMIQQLVKGSLLNAPLNGQYFIGVEKKVAQQMSVAIGPVVHSQLIFGSQNYYRPIAERLSSYEIIEKNYTNGNTLQVWIGGKISIKFF
jgi:hypothetical protein